MKSIYKKLLFSLLLLSGCKTTQTLKHSPHLRTDGFYYTQYNKTTINDTQLLRFYSNGSMVELAVSDTEEKLNEDANMLACLLDTVVHKGAPQGPALYKYRTKGDSIFFKKKNWDFDELYYNLAFACKLYNDSMIVRVTPVDYDTTGTGPTKLPRSYTTTLKFKQAGCDTAFQRKMSTFTNRQ